MASYDLAGSRVRWINYEGETSTRSGAYTQYRARADITTTDYPTYVTITVSPGFVYGKQKYGPQLMSYSSRFTVTSILGQTKAGDCNFSTYSYGTAQSAQTIVPISQYSYNINKLTSSRTETLSVKWTGYFELDGGGSGGSVTIQNTNDYSTGTGTSGSATSQGSISISIPALPLYTLSYDANGGSGAPSGTTTVYYGQTVTLSSTKPTRSGYYFRGWSLSASATTASYSAGGNYTDSAHENKKLYAVWHRCPTCTYSVSSSDPYYNSGKAYSVSVTNATLYDSASLSKLELKLGSLSNSSTSTTIPTSSSPRILSITPTTTGTFTPTITITDNIGASTTIPLSTITVKQYVAPSIIISAERVNAQGIPSNEEVDIDDSNNNPAIYALLTVTFTVPSKDYYSCTVPEVSITGTDSHTVEWYSTRDSDKKVSGGVTWSNVTTNTTVYALISGCDTTNSYTFYVTPEDTRGSGTLKAASIAHIFYTIDFLAGGQGLAFGKAADKTGIDCSMDFYLDNEKPIKAVQPRKVAGGGGWAYTPFRFVDSTDTSFAYIGAYGSADTYNYMYLGSNTYNGNNLRVYPDGHIWAPTIEIQKITAATNTFADANPKIIFKNSDGSQSGSLTWTDYDAVQAPASLTLNGNQGGEYFIAPNIKATTMFYGALTGNVTGNCSGSSGSCTGNAVNVTGTVTVAHGGTGATTAAAARANLATPAMVIETYSALLPINGSNGWIKIGTANTSYGILPSQAGSAGSGHNYIGTSGWYWKYAYIDNIYCVDLTNTGTTRSEYFRRTATTASTSATANMRITSDGSILPCSGWTSSSARYKEAIDKITEPEIDPKHLYDIEVVQFKYTADRLNNPEDMRTDRLLPGFIAEQVYEVYPVAVDLENGEPETWSDRYIIPPMLALIQEQKKEIDELRNKIQDLEEKI